MYPTLLHPETTRETAQRCTTLRDPNRRHHAKATQPALLRPCAWAPVAGSYAKCPKPLVRSTVFK